MHHWHCHASNQQQTTNNKLLCRLQGTPLVPYTAHGAQQAHSNRDEIQPIHRCTVPSICPHTNTQVYRSFHLPAYQYTGVTFQPSAHVPIHRCAAPSICPQNIPANVFVLVLLLKTKFRDERLEHILGHMFREKVCSISRTRNLL